MVRFIGKTLAVYLFYAPDIFFSRVWKQQIDKQRVVYIVQENGGTKLEKVALVVKKNDFSLHLSQVVVVVVYRQSHNRIVKEKDDSSPLFLPRIQIAALKVKTSLLVDRLLPTLTDSTG